MKIFPFVVSVALMFAANGLAAPGESIRPGAARPRTPPAMATSGAFLEVGAFPTVAAAQPLLKMLRGLGLKPSIIDQPGHVIVVTVGPFRGRALADVRAKLQAEGIDSFQIW